MACLNTSVTHIHTFAYTLSSVLKDHFQKKKPKIILMSSTTGKTLEEMQETHLQTTVQISGACGNEILNKRT